MAPTSLQSTPRIVILGGGFAGLYAARELRRVPARLTLIDRSNHHLFQPLLYQVATASLSPADIAAPIRNILSRQKNCEVLLAEATRIDAPAKKVILTDGEVAYDYLIIATGATHSYFGHDEWEPLAPGLKSIDDALEIRRRFLVAFEQAERETDPVARRAALTFVVIGAGPTGVELAGAMAEIARRAIHRDFRRIDTTTARVILIEGRERVLPAFDEDLSRRAKADLEALGVDVWVSTRVTNLSPGVVEIGPERISAKNVFWAAGVTASPLARSLGAPLDNAGRVRVNPDLSVPDHPEIFVAGDLASIDDPKSKQPVPGVAPAAMQMGRHAARLIARELSARNSSNAAAPARQPFIYNDRGMLATIGRAKAVGVMKGLKTTGFIAWAAWLFIHVLYLVGFRNRVLVMLQWAWAYVTFDRGARLITGGRTPSAVTRPMN